MFRIVVVLLFRMFSAEELSGECIVARYYRYCVSPLTLAALLIFVMHLFIDKNGAYISLMMTSHFRVLSICEMGGTLSFLTWVSAYCLFLAVYTILKLITVLCGFIWSTRGK